MTNAERQKRYRDRKRGGPPVGRWLAGYKSVETTVAEEKKLWSEPGMGRTMVFMLLWLKRMAPAVERDADKVRISTTYKRLRAVYKANLRKAVNEATANQRAFDGWSLRVKPYDPEHGFVIYWVRQAKETQSK